MLEVLLILYLMLLAVPFWAQRHEIRAGKMNLVRPDLLMSGAFALYTLPVPIDALLWQEWFGYSVGATRADIVVVFAYTFVFHAALLTGYYFGGSRRGVQRFVPLAGVFGSKLLDGRPPNFLLWMAVLSGIGLYVAYIYVQFGGIINYVFLINRLDRFSGAVGFGFLTIGIYIANAALIFVLGVRVVKGAGDAGGRRLSYRAVTLLVSFIIVLVYCSFFLTIGDRRQPFSLILAGVAMIAILKGTRLVPVSIAGALALPVVQVFSKVRGRASTPSQMIEFVSERFTLSWLNLANGELGANFVVTTKIVNDVSYLEWGWTYILSLIYFVPSAIFPGERPEAPPVWFARTFFPDLAERGGAFGFSAVGESVLNFGFAGPMVIGVIFGFALRRSYDYLIVNIGWKMYGVVIYAASVPFLFTIPRTDMVSLLKIVVFAIFLPIAAIRIASWGIRPRRVKLGAGHPPFHSVTRDGAHQ